jgi:hypothetical protein
MGKDGHTGPDGAAYDHHSDHQHAKEDAVPEHGNRAILVFDAFVQGLAVLAVTPFVHDRRCALQRMSKILTGAVGALKPLGPKSVNAFVRQA